MTTTEVETSETVVLRDNATGETIIVVVPTGWEIPANYPDTLVIVARKPRN